MAYYCTQCQKELSLSGQVGRTEECAFCKTDLHCCLNCVFYDTSAYNDCREPNAERVLDKDKANFCDYFKFVSDRRQSSAKANSAKSELEALFKKP